LLTADLTPAEIGRELDLVPTTVSYHIERLAADGSADSTAAQPPPGPAVTTSKTRSAVARMLSENVPRAEIARPLGISKATVSYHAARLGRDIDERCARRYDWEAIQRHYDDGHTVRECMRQVGFSSSSWSDAVRRGVIISRPGATPIDEFLVAGTYRGRHNLKARLLKEGLKDRRCERCGLVDWEGEPLTLALHHINGERSDNRLETLELLCPNCHSQTSTDSGRNGHRRGRSG
jgi:DNA-binding CsgD family transcriptional regulator/5-methylcytosine-specific restriction endonuclease McrA